MIINYILILIIDNVTNCWTIIKHSKWFKNYILTKLKINYKYYFWFLNLQNNKNIATIYKNTIKLISYV